MSMRSLPKILLVEDNPDHAALAKGALLKPGGDSKYEVDIASSAEEAMEKLASALYNMVISDHRLPGKTGLDLLLWMREQKMNLPFIMLTGAGDEKTAVTAMQNGAYNYIVKDDSYLAVLPHAVGETFIEFLADLERTRYENEIRAKNVELERANRELKKLDQLKSDFIASVSHDLRTPLNSVQESILLILDGIVQVSDEKGQRVLEIAHRNIKRLATMINDLLDFSKLEEGKMRLHIESANLETLIDEALGNLKALADKKKIGLKFDLVEGFPLVDCDGDRIVQVLTNLIGNAIKFTPEEGTITVAHEVSSSNQVKVAVRDTGIGIPQDDLGRVFERFEQVKGANTQCNKGTGLGLAICKELLKLHRGEIWVESELGKGSSFIFTLPIKST